MVLPVAAVRAETGYDLWLRYVALDDAALRETYRRAVTALVAPDDSPTARLTRDELRRGLRGLLGVDVAVAAVRPGRRCGGGRDAGERRPRSPASAGATDLARAGSEGYLIRIGARRSAGQSR